MKTSNLRIGETADNRFETFSGHSDSLASRRIAKSQNRVCKSRRSTKLRTVFDYTLPMTLHSITHLLASVRYAAFGGQLQPRPAATPAFGFHAIATNLRTPFARLSAARIPRLGERLPAPVASFFEVVFRSTKQFAALFFGKLH